MSGCTFMLFLIFNKKDFSLPMLRLMWAMELFYTAFIMWGTLFLYPTSWEYFLLWMNVEFLYYQWTIKRSNQEKKFHLQQCQGVNYLRTNKVGKGLYAKNYKVLLKDIIDYFIFLIQNINSEFLIQNIILYYKINGKHFLDWWSELFDIIKMSMLPKVIYRFNAIPNKSPNIFCTNRNLHLKIHMKSQGNLNQQDNLEKKNRLVDFLFLVL